MNHQTYTWYSTNLVTDFISQLWNLLDKTNSNLLRLMSLRYKLCLSHLNLSCVNRGASDSSLWWCPLSLHATVPVVQHTFSGLPHAPNGLLNFHSSLSPFRPQEESIRKGKMKGCSGSLKEPSQKSHQTTCT